MRALLVMLLSACSTGDPLVVVTVSSPLQSLTGLAKLHATATAAGHVKELDVAFSSGATFDIPPQRTFGVEIPEGYAGMFAISVDAVDGSGNTVISGSGSTTTSIGHRSDVSIVLGEGGDGGSDGGNSCAQANYGCGMLNGVDCGPCMLTSLHPAVAKAGDSVVLEGAFNPNVTAIFPGSNKNVMLTLLGPNRATAVVPGPATAGLVALEADNAQAPLKQPFRRVTFDLALHEFHQQYQQSDFARPMAEPTIGHSLGTALAIGNTVEILGGEAGSPSPTPLPTVEFATGNADGTLGIFAADDSRPLTTARSAFVVYNSGSDVYVIGGQDRGGMALSTIERAAAVPSGNGTARFVPATVELNVPRWFAASAVIGKYLYVFGGGNGRFGTAAAQVLKTAERAPISDSDGSLGAFTPAMSPLSGPRAGATAIVLLDHVYLIGGIDGAGNVVGSIDAAPINPDGTLGQFSTMGPSLKVGRALPGVVQLGARVYVLGGVDQGGGLSSIESAPIDAGGSLGNFTVEPISLKSAHAGQPLLFGNYLHYFENAPGERAAIGGGGVGPFADSGRALLQATTQMTAAVVGANFYLFGGFNAGAPQASIARAAVDPDGTLNAFFGAGTVSLAHPRAAAAAAVFERDIWICGGNDGTSMRSDCEGFTAQPDGSLVALTVNADMGVKRAGLQLMVVGSVLYAVGGDQGGWDSVQFIALDATRHPTGAWSAAATAQFPAKGADRYGYLGDADLYVFGGDMAGLTTVDAGWSGSTLGSFAAAPTLAQGPLRSNASLLGLGSWVVVAGGTDQASGGALDSVWLAPQGGSFADTARHLLHARRGHNGATLGNYVYVLGGGDGTGIFATIEQAPLQ